jgi:hypothetical protein
VRFIFKPWGKYEEAWKRNDCWNLYQREQNCDLWTNFRGLYPTIDHLLIVENVDILDFFIKKAKQFFYFVWEKYYNLYLIVYKLKNVKTFVWGPLQILEHKKMKKNMIIVAHKFQSVCITLRFRFDSHSPVYANL